MIVERTCICGQVWNIAMKYNIPQVTVHQIINTYILYCKELLKNGERVDFYGLVSIIPNVMTTNFAPTLAYNCEKVASILSLSSNTVFWIMRAYIDDAIQSVKDGTNVEIRGIVVCRPIWENGELVKVHSNISQSLKNILVNSPVGVTSVRASTYKCLRDSIISA